MIRILDRIITLLERLLIVIAGVALVAMGLITCANILFRMDPIGCPIKGSVELVGLAGALVAASALARTQRRKEHIAVDALVSLYPPALRRGLDLIGQLACMIFAAIVAWRVTLLGWTQVQSGELTETLRIVPYPVTFGVALGFVVLTLVFCSNLLKDILTRTEASQ